MLRRAFIHLREQMLALDPTALTPADDCVWAHWLEEWESQILKANSEDGDDSGGHEVME